MRRRGDLAGDLRRARQRARELPRDVAVASADPAGSAVVAGARSVRGSLSLSGLGAVLGVTTRVGGSGRRSSVTISATPRGAWAVASGTKPHAIRPKGRRRAVLTPDGPRAQVEHPGTARVDLWGKSTSQAQSGIDGAVESAADDAVGKVLRF